MGACPEKLDLARQMRNAPTSAERALWQALRGRALAGFKFRRQHVIAGFIADLYCPAAHLVVEVDGGIHKGRRTHDAGRDEVFRNLGVMVLRVANDDILRRLDTVLNLIRGACESRSEQPLNE